MAVLASAPCVVAGFACDQRGRRLGSSNRPTRAGKGR